MSKYPNWASGDEITADLLKAGLPEFIVSDSDQTVNNTVTLVDSTELTTTLSANAVYEIFICIVYAPGGATADFRTDWVVPSGATGLKWVTGLDDSVSDTTPSGIVRMGMHAHTTDITYGNRGANTNSIVAFEGGIITTTNAGTFNLRFAQGTAQAVDTVLQDGSYMKITRIS